MKLTIAALTLVGTASAFFQMKPTGRVTFQTSLASSVDIDTSQSKFQQRRQISKGDKFFRTGFKDKRKTAERNLEEQYQSNVVAGMKDNNFKMERDGVTVHLAKDFGFCWGVERSIALAYEAVEQYPDKKLHITNELIHNPEVNDRLHEYGINFIEKNADGSKDFSPVGENDVVIYPAFGASLDEMKMFSEKGVDVVDTTCPWVSKVWSTVEKHQRNDLTSVIHGKYGHEETIATASFCEDYICVKNMDEAEYVANYMLNGGDKEEFMQKFSKAISEGFDPDTMLDKVGLANQTTMYKQETRAIGQLFQKTMISKFGPANLNEHYLEFDTICDATQERQDAVSYLVENAKELELDFILVVGGWDSSNTAHLLEIPRMAGIRSFHINRAECIKPDNTITHREMDGTIVTEKFLLENIVDGENKVKMGLTSGASTPDKAVEDSLGQIFLLNSVLNSSAQKEEVQA